jgi:hypothetical protein
MSFEIFFPYENNQYGDGILLEEYNEKFSLYQAQKSNDGPIYKRWGRVKIGKDKYTEKDVPIQIKLGNQNEAIEALKYFLEQLNAPADDSPF